MSFPTVAPVVITTTTPAPVEVKPAPVVEVAKPVLEPVYAPVNYAPANTAYPHNSVWNLVVPDSEHHKIKHLKVLIGFEFYGGYSRLQNKHRATLIVFEKI